MRAAKVINLVPGDVVAMPMGGRATFVARTPHPLYDGLKLVIWWLDRDAIDGDRWSFDALSSLQEVGEVVSDPSERRDNLRAALHGGGG